MWNLWIIFEETWATQERKYDNFLRTYKTQEKLKIIKREGGLQLHL